uniref:Ileal sodium/bile acid cotransporter n=1 Tax=Romanomermis culicivorax TaxID=13658 RepID=A0A915JUL4_ROMCU
MNALALGMFTTGCPGGGASNGYSVLLDANVDLSIAMTFLSTVAALIMMPFWMLVLGRTFLVNSANKHISVPFNNIFYSLIALILRPFLLVIIVFICTFGVYANFYMFRLMTWRVLLAGMLLPLLGFIFGAVSSLLMKQPLSNIKAIAIETGIQNTGIGIVLLQDIEILLCTNQIHGGDRNKLSFGQPEADLAAVVPVVVAMFTPPPLLLALAVHYVQKCRSKKQFSDKQILNDEKDRRKIAESVSSIGDGGKKSKLAENGVYSEDEDFKTSDLRLVDSMKPLCQNCDQNSEIIEEDNRAVILEEVAAQIFIGIIR